MGPRRLLVWVFTLGFGRSYIDLFVAVAAIVATAFTVLVDVSPVLRTPLALLTVFVVPGYTLTLVLFPRGESSLQSFDRSKMTDGLPLLDRMVLSVALSLVAVILMGVALDSMPVALSTESLLAGLVAVMGVAFPVALAQRLRLPPDERFTPFPPRESESVGASPDPQPAGQKTVLRVVLALSVIFAGGAVAYSSVMADGDESITEFYFLTEDEDGELQADDYPTDLTRDESTSLTLAVGNRRDEATTYSVVGQVQRVEQTDEEVVIEEREEFYGEQLTVSAGETELLDTRVTPDATGEFRLVFLLYVDGPPNDPRIDDAHREIHLWVEVSEPTDATTE